MKLLNSLLATILTLSGPFAFAAEGSSPLAQPPSRGPLDDTSVEVPPARLDRAISQMVEEMKRFNPELDVTLATASLRRLAKLVPSYRYKFYLRRPRASSLNERSVRVGLEAGELVVKAMKDYILGLRADVAAGAQDAVRIAINAALLNGAGLPEFHPMSISKTLNSFLFDRQLERDFWPAVRSRIQANAKGINKELMESFLTAWKSSAAETSTFTGFVTTLRFSGWLNPRQVLPPELPDCPMILGGG